MRCSLGDFGLRCFNQQLSLFPGLRAALKARMENPVAFTFYPDPSVMLDPAVWARDGIFDARERGMTRSEEASLDECDDFVWSYLRRDIRNIFLVQGDHYRLDRRDSDGTVAVGQGERLIVLPLDKPFLGYSGEVWIYLRARDAIIEDVQLTINRGTLHPRALGVLTRIESTLETQIQPEALIDEICDNSTVLIYDAFDGQWPIFLQLRS